MDREANLRWNRLKVAKGQGGSRVPAELDARCGIDDRLRAIGSRQARDGHGGSASGNPFDARPPEIVRKAVVVERDNCIREGELSIGRDKLPRRNILHPDGRGNRDIQVVLVLGVVLVVGDSGVEEVISFSDANIVDIVVDLIVGEQISRSYRELVKPPEHFARPDGERPPPGPGPAAPRTACSRGRTSASRH